MGVVVGILAFIGLVALIFVVVAAVAPEKPQQAPVEHDLAAPYREGLYAAMRMQGAAQDLEQQIYSEALAHREQMPPGA